MIKNHAHKPDEAREQEYIGKRRGEIKSSRGRQEKPSCQAFGNYVVENKPRKKKKKNWR